MIVGLEHFSNFFRDFDQYYVVVGGVAATLLLEKENLEFRATKDIDLVLVSSNNEEILSRLVDYIKLAKYKIQQKGSGKNVFYRFKEPSDKKYPFQIEIFHKKPEGIKLIEGQHLVPIKDEVDGIGLSAILLEEEYFDLVKNNVEIAKGIPITTTAATIILKARAYNDLTDRKNSGDQVDVKDINKHRGDIFRLTQILTETENMTLRGLPRTHLDRFVADIDSLSEVHINQIFKNLKIGLTKKDWLDSIRNYFI